MGTPEKAQISGESTPTKAGEVVEAENASLEHLAQTAIPSDGLGSPSCGDEVSETCRMSVVSKNSHNGAVTNSVAIFVEPSVRHEATQHATARRIMSQITTAAIDSGVVRNVSIGSIPRTTVDVSPNSIVSDGYLSLTHHCT